MTMADPNSLFSGLQRSQTVQRPMANTISSTGTNNRFNLSQIVALSFIYKRLLKSCFVLPCIAIFAPVVWKLTCIVCDRITANHSLLSLTLTTYSTFLTRRLIWRSAPSKEAASKSLEKTELQLPCLLFLGSVLFIRFFVVPLEATFGLKNILQWSPTIPFFSAMRLAIGMSLLSLSVISRFVGPASIVRCSSSPLLAHPFTTMAASVLSQVNSAGAFLDFIAGPNNELTSSQIAPSSSNESYKSDTARRLQRPRFDSILKQIVSSALIGIALAYTSILPFCASVNGDIPHKSALISSCAFATVMSLSRLLDGSSHEINPNRYSTSPSLVSLFSVMPSMPLSSIGVLILALLCSSLSIEDINGGTTGKVITMCIFSVVLVTLYLHVFEEILRIILCSPPENMKEVIEEIVDDDRMETFLDVVMCSILHSDLNLVGNLCKSVKGRLLNLDREELALNEESTKAMAHVLLQKTAADENGAHLEEDILRLSLLASLGGTGEHPNRTIQQWFESQHISPAGTSSHEFLSVPLLRALCVYIGGLGEALITVCSNTQNNLKASMGSPWLLPPGAILCGEYAIRGATRCIVWNLTNSERCRADWRGSHISMLIPVLLQSVCRLENGMIKYSELRRGSLPYTGLPRKLIHSTSNSLVIAEEVKLTPEQKLQLIKTESPELLSLYQACTDTAVEIIEKLRALEGTTKIELPVFGECRRWIDNILLRVSLPQSFVHNAITK